MSRHGEKNPAIRHEADLPLFAEQSFTQFEQQTSGLSGDIFHTAQCETGAVPRRSEGSIGTVPDVARARRDDPATSHAASRSVTNLGPTKDGILQVLRLYGPSTDERIALCYHGLRSMGKELPQSSPSGLRSRRAWLVENGFVEACGIGKTVSRRDCQIWRLK